VGKPFEHCVDEIMKNSSSNNNNNNNNNNNSDNLESEEKIINVVKFRIRPFIVGIAGLSEHYPCHVQRDDIRGILASAAARLFVTAVQYYSSAVSNENQTDSDLDSPSWFLSSVGFTKDTWQLSPMDANLLYERLLMHIPEWLANSANVDEGSLQGEAARMYYVFSLGTLLEFRRKGIGRALVKEARNEAIRKGKSIVYLHVSEYNRTAIEVYESCGFTVLYISNDYYTIGGQWYNGLVYASFLDDSMTNPRLFTRLFSAVVREAQLQCISFMQSKLDGH